MIDPRRNDELAQKIGALVREQAHAWPERARLAERNRFAAAVRAESANPAAGRARWGGAGGKWGGVGSRWVGGLAAAAALAIVVAGGVYGWSDDDLAYEVKNAEADDGGFVHAGAASDVRIEFSDGSSVQLEPLSSVRVVELDEDGARLILEEGRVHVNVIHEDDTDWSVQAGPYTVAVVGTRFDVGWRPDEKRFQVVMHEGEVRLSGPQAPDGLPVRGGQTVTAVGAGDLLLSARDERADTSAGGGSGTLGGAPVEGSPGDGAPDAVADATPGSEHGDERAPTEAPAESSAKPAAPAVAASWAQMVAEGQFSKVVDAARAMGIETALATASKGDLIALGDAARYEGQSGISTRVLHALRDRFGGSTAAANAAFLLGRMAHDGGAHAGAVRWFDVYLSEAPGGTFASEALGRKMLAIQASQGDAAARPIAQQYLAAYPKGSLASVANAILEP